jgi:CBS-domain-containing membrane protein
MKARDVMTQTVITVSPETSIREIATILSDKHFSGLPVVSDDGKILGIVSESDLLHRAELGTERRRKWWFRMFGDTNTLARDFAKAHGLKAKDVMSRHVISVGDEAELRDVAEILDSHCIKRVPVIQGGKLIGLVTRGDLVRALSRFEGSGAGAVDNAGLHKLLRGRIREQPWLNKNFVNLSVDNGVVELWGYVDSVDEHNALRVLVEETSGVKRVDDNIMVGAPIRPGV